MQGELRALRGNLHIVESVAFQPHGARLATAERGYLTVRLWDTASGEEVAVLRGHEHPVVSVAFSADGTRLASASNHSVRLWDAATGEEVAVLRGNGIRSVAFSQSALAPVTVHIHSI